MPKVIISDTSCFILLSAIDQLDLLQKLYGDILTTSDVAEEFGIKLPPWVIISSPKNLNRMDLLLTHLGKGEASAISLAIEIPDCVIILDDSKARRVAERLGLNITGTLGIIIHAKLEGVISSIKPILDAIRNTSFYLSDELVQFALREAEEAE